MNDDAHMAAARRLLARIKVQNGHDAEVDEDEVEAAWDAAEKKTIWHQYEFGAPVKVVAGGEEFHGYLTTLQGWSDPALDGVVHLPQVDEGRDAWVTLMDLGSLDWCESIEIGSP